MLPKTLNNFHQPEYDRLTESANAASTQNKRLNRQLAFLSCLCPAAFAVGLAIGNSHLRWYQYLFGCSAALLLSSSSALKFAQSVTGRVHETLDFREYSTRAANAQIRLMKRALGKISSPIFSALIKQATSLSDQATNLNLDNRSLSLAIADAKASSANADELTHQAADRALNLAQSISATTTHIANAANIAVTLANTAFAAARTITVLDGRLAPINESIATLDMLLTRAASTLPIESTAPADMALTNQVAALGRAGLIALTEMKHVITNLREDAEIATQRCQEIAYIVQTQHQAGEDLSLSVLAQAEEITAIARYLENTRGGVSQLRRQVEMVANRQSQNEAAIRELSESARILPSCANEIVNLFTEDKTFHTIDGNG